MKPVKHLDTEPAIVSRIVDLLKQQGKQQQDLTAYLGLQKNNLSEWKRGTKRSYHFYIDDIARYFNVSPTYLLRGSDDVFSADDVLFERFRAMNDEQKGRLLAVAEQILSEG